MAQRHDPTQALDQLQREINSIFEQVGRLLVAAGNPDSGVAQARALQLKQHYPASEIRFHEALDTLDEELQHAKAVVRRDLAVSRDRESIHPRIAGSSKKLVQDIAAVETAALAPDPITKAPVSSPNAKSPILATPEEFAQQRSPGVSAKTEQLSTVETASSKPPDTSSDQLVDHTLEIDTNTPRTGTKGEAQSDEERPPDTATMSANADLDSLFNDPASASGPGTGSGPGTAFDEDMNTNGDFDFATFNASLDNGTAQDGNDRDTISALIPGLQDYANETTADPDLDAMFAPVRDSNGDVFDGFGADEQGNGEPQDNIFDDFMDIQFDMSATGKDGEAENQEFDFDFS